MDTHTYTHTYIHTYTQDNYNHPRCAHARHWLIIIIIIIILQAKRHPSEVNKVTRVTQGSSIGSTEVDNVTVSVLSVHQSGSRVHMQCIKVSG